MERSYQTFRPMIQAMGRDLPQGTVFLDAGSGEGFYSLLFAADLKAKQVILIDIDKEPEVELPPHAEFHRLDIQSEKFVRKFQNRANVVVCLTTLHECSNPVIAASNLIKILPVNGVAVIMDFCGEGWEYQFQLAQQEGLGQMQHHMLDLATAGPFGLTTDEDIRQFWEEGMFPRVPGQCHLKFNGHLYIVMYLAKQWGEVKKPPPDIAALLKSLGR